MKVSIFADRKHCMRPSKDFVCNKFYIYVQTTGHIQ